MSKPPIQFNKDIKLLFFFLQHVKQLDVCFSLGGQI